MPIGDINWRKILNKSSWVICTIILSIIAGLITIKITKKTASLVINCNSSYMAGQTVIDIIIKNDGDYDLNGLSAVFEFEKEPSVSINPEEFNKFISIKGDIFQLLIPENIELKKNQQIELRFISRGSNRINNLNSIPKHIYSQYILSNKVCAILRTEGMISNYTINDRIVAIIFIIASTIIIAVALYYRKQPSVKNSDPMK